MKIKKAISIMAAALCLLLFALFAPAATAKAADGLSCYTVEFTYSGLQYVLPGNSAVALSDILSRVGLSGQVTAAEVSDSSLFSATNTSGGWIVTAHKAFNTAEWLRVTIDGKVYEIAVTDATITQSGTIGTNVTWEIDSDGALTIRPTDAGSEALLENICSAQDTNQNAAIRQAWPWLTYSGSIKKVVMPEVISISGDVRHMFSGCTNLQQADIKLSKSGYTTVNDMFRGCSSLEKVSFTDTSFNQSGRLFKDCSKVSSVSFNNCDLSAVTAGNTSSMFEGCSSSMTTLSVSNTNFSNAVLSALNSVSSLNTLKLTGPMSSGSSVKDIISVLPRIKTVDITGSPNTSATAYDLNKVPVDVSIISDGTAYVSDFNTGEWSFNGEEDLDSDGLNAKLSDGKLPAGTLIKTGQSASEATEFLNDPEVSWKFEKGKLTIFPTNGASGTIYNNYNKAAWPWDSFRSDIKEVVIEDGVKANGGTSLMDMFSGCTALTNVDVSGLDISGGYHNLSGMFENCVSLTDLALKFKDNNPTSSNTTMNRMFSGCSSLKNLDLSGASSYINKGTSSYGFTSNFFGGNSALETINIGGIVFGENATIGNFGSMPALKNIVVDSSTNNGKAFSFASTEGTWELNGEKLEQSGDGMFDVPAGTSGTIVKTSDQISGFDNIEPTYYVIDKLGEFEVQVWNGTSYDTYTSDDLSSFDNNAAQDSNAPYFIRKENANGKEWLEFYTTRNPKQNWVNGSTHETRISNTESMKGYVYDAKSDAPDIIIKYKDAALDVNGNRHDVVINIDKFTFYDSAKITSSNEFRRDVLGVSTESLAFRNYVVDETVSWDHGEDHGGIGNQGSGTWTDAAIKIDGAAPDQTFLFYVGDLDVRKSSNGYGVGAEGIELGDGFDLDTLRLADYTKLTTYFHSGNENYDKATDATAIGILNPLTGEYGNYIVGTDRDDDTYMSRFYVSGDASGASFTWTSGINCDTFFLDKRAVLDVWTGMPPVSVEIEAAKQYTGFPINEVFKFTLTPDSRNTIDGLTNKAKDANAPQVGTATVTVTTEGEYTITFPEMTFALLNRGETFNPIGTYWYVMEEVVENPDPAIEYDTASHTVKIVITGAYNDLGAATLGYTLKLYIDGEENPVLTTHSQKLTVDYGTAKRAASGATSADFLSKTFANDSNSWTFNEDENAWYRNDGVKEDPPADATADFDLTYAHAVTMARAGSSDDVTDTKIKEHVWTEENERYRFESAFGPITLDYSTLPASNVSSDEAKQKIWIDDTVTPKVIYKWESTPDTVKFGGYTHSNKNSRTWIDSEGNTYKYEELTTPMTMGEARDNDVDITKIRRALWKDNGNYYVYGYNGYQVNYQTDPSQPFYYYVDDDGTLHFYYKYRPVYNLKNGEMVPFSWEDIFNVGGMIIRPEIDSSGRSFRAFYRARRDTNGEFLRDANGYICLEKIKYVIDNKEVVTGIPHIPPIADSLPTGMTEAFAGDTVKYTTKDGSEYDGPITTENYENSGTANYNTGEQGISQVLAWWHETRTKSSSSYVPTAEKPPEQATHGISSRWGTYTNPDLPGYSSAIEYENIPDTATADVPNGNYGWVKYSIDGEKLEQDVTPPDDAISENPGTHDGWVKYIVDDNGEEKRVGEVDAPSPESKAHEQDKTTLVEVTLTDVWIKETKTSDSPETWDFVSTVNQPTNDSTSTFTLTYADSSYAVNDGLVKEDIEALTWTDGDDKYTYDKTNGWQKEDAGGNVTPVTAPPDTATAVLWEDSSKYKKAQSGVEFNNKFRTFDLTISKEVTGNIGSKARDWDFEITLKDRNDDPFTIDPLPANLTPTTNAGTYTFKLKHEESAVIPGLPYGASYEIKENNVPSGYTVSAVITGDENTKDGTSDETKVALNSNNSVSDTSLIADTTVTFKNKNEVSPPTGVFDDVSPALAGIAAVALMYAVLLLLRKREA